MPRGPKNDMTEEVEEISKADLAMELKMAKVLNDVPIDQLVPADYNPREQVEPGTRLWKELEASLREFGFVDPVVVNKDWTIIGGHQRVTVAKALGFKTCIVSQVDVDKTREKAMNIALNKITGTWKEAQLADLLQDIKLSGDIMAEAMGYDEAEMEKAMQAASKQVKDDDDFDEDAEMAKPLFTKFGDLWHLGEHRIINGDSTLPETFERLMGGKKANLVLTDPPYNVNVEETAGKILNDNMGDSEFHDFLYKAYTQMYNSLADDGSIYVWHADTEGINFRTAFKEAGFYLSGCCIWVKDSLVLGRSPYQWRHEPCSIKGTLVRTPTGEVPIEKINDGDEVVAWDRGGHKVIGYQRGIPVETAHRHYKGLIYGINSDNKQTWVTDNHRFTVKYTSEAAEKYCTYLMLSKDGLWRVGCVKFMNTNGLGVKERFHHEDAFAMWILEVFDEKSRAEMSKQFITVNYGIPSASWTTDEGKELFSKLKMENVAKKARALLVDYKRSLDYPLITLENVSTPSSKLSLVNACNIIPGIMQVPIPYQRGSKGKTFDWCVINEVKTKKYDGEVYSLKVPRFEHYIADGIVTHNCLYGWKKKGKHQWYSDRKQTTVWEYDKPRSSKDHPTSKPVPLMSYPIKNSTMTNGLVLDSFLGSGATLIACCETDRICYGVELDSKFVDVEVKRYINWRGGDTSDVWVERNGQHLTFEEALKDSNVVLTD